MSHIRAQILEMSPEYDADDVKRVLQKHAARGAIAIAHPYESTVNKFAQARRACRGRRRGRCADAGERRRWPLLCSHSRHTPHASAGSGRAPIGVLVRVQTDGDDEEDLVPED